MTQENVCRTYIRYMVDKCEFIRGALHFIDGYLNALEYD